MKGLKLMLYCATKCKLSKWHILLSIYVEIGVKQVITNCNNYYNYSNTG